MSDVKRRIFISDIHLGDENSMTGEQPWGLFKNNIPLLTEFLDELWTGTGVEELVILGDLFDQWIVPADKNPLTSFYPICVNQLNKPVIDKLKSLAMSYDIKLTYLPGSHDMAMDREATSLMKDYMQNTFLGINVISESDASAQYVYKPAKLVAEHGNRFCLFSAPGRWTDLDGRVRDSFLPLGYFISRMAAYKSSKTGNSDYLCDILNKFIEVPNDPGLIEQLLGAIAEDCGLEGGEICLRDLPGYGISMNCTMKIEDIGKLFRDMKSKWGKVCDAGKIGLDSAVENDLGNLNGAADKAFFYPGSQTKIVIFGHTHVPTLWKGGRDGDAKSDPNNTPCPVIYANCGTWVDEAGYRGTYVETEESDGRCWVRVKEYPGKKVINHFEGFVEI